MKKRILIIDLETDFIHDFSDLLTKEGYNVQIAEAIDSAWTFIKQNPDLILLDFVLASINNWEIIRNIKHNTATSAIPIIVLSSKESEASEIISLEIGADDYILKPIQTQRLLARIRAILRQQYELRTTEGDEEILSFNGLEIHIPGYMITYEKSTLVFPRKEFNILVLLARRPGKVFTREEISLAVWGESDHTTNRTIDVHIGRIRKKLNRFVTSIETVPGVGYRFHA